MQFLFGFRFGGCAHPRQSVDFLVHGRFDVMHHLNRGLLAGGREFLGDIDLTERFAQGSIGDLHATLPAGALLGLPGQLAPVEVKDFVIERLG